MKRLILICLFATLAASLGPISGAAYAGCSGNSNSEIDQYSEQVPTGGCDQPTQGENGGGGSGTSGSGTPGSTDGTSGSTGSSDSGGTGAQGTGGGGGNGAQSNSSGFKKASSRHSNTDSSGPVGVGGSESPLGSDESPVIDAGSTTESDSSGFPLALLIVIGASLLVAGGYYLWLRRRGPQGSHEPTS